MEFMDYFSVTFTVAVLIILIITLLVATATKVSYSVLQRKRRINSELSMNLESYTQEILDPENVGDPISGVAVDEATRSFNSMVMGGVSND